MSADLYRTGVSGLLTAQQQLATTGHNIANVNTEGYSRQRVEQVTNPALRTGNSYVGSGVNVNSINRIYDQFAYREQIVNQGLYSNAQKLSDKLSGLNDITSTGQDVISSALTSFYDSLNSLSDSPNDSGLRDLVLSRANQLTSAMKSLKGSYDIEQSTVNGEIQQTVDRINQLGKDIAKLNVQIVAATGTQASPNDLLDQRDQLVSQLSKLTTVSTVTNDNGSLTVMVGDSQPFVMEDRAMSLKVKPGDPNTKQTDIFISGGRFDVKLKSSQLGGELGALFEYRDQDLDQVQKDLDRTAMSVAETFNKLQAQGVDLNGLNGENFFSDINATSVARSRVAQFTDNAGSEVLEVNVTDTSILPADEYELTFDGTNYVLTSRSDGSSQTLGAPGSGPFDSGLGFEIAEGSGTPAAGDRWSVTPTHNGVTNFDVNLQHSESIAASSPVEVTPDSDNVSQGTVSVGNFTDPVAAQALGPITVDVIEDGSGNFTYTISDDAGNTVTSQPYTPPEQTISWPPAPATSVMDITIAGDPSGEQPNAPERFVIDDAVGTGNSNNLLDMIASQSNGTLEEGELSFQESLDQAATRVGARAADKEAQASSSEAMLTQSKNRLLSVSGVNIDEEASNLMQFQQAYQASARVISVANTIFDTLLQSV